MLSRRIPAVLAGVLLGSLLAVPLTSSPAYAGTRVQIDNDDYDVLHRDIDMDKLKVTYDGKGVRATITMKNLQEEEAAPDLRRHGDPGGRQRPASPEFGHLIEFRLNEHRKQKVVNWVATLPPTTTTSSRSARASRSRRTTSGTR